MESYRVETIPFKTYDEFFLKILIIFLKKLLKELYKEIKNNFM